MIEQMTRLGMDVEYEVFCLMMLDVFDVASMGGWVIESYVSNQWINVSTIVDRLRSTTNYSHDR